MTNREAVEILKKVVDASVQKGIFANSENVELVANAIRVIYAMDVQINHLTGLTTKSDIPLG
jgi:hypothetical protein